MGKVVLIKMASESNTAFPPNNSLVDEFEEAFQGIIHGFTKEDGVPHTQDNKEELRTDAEQNVSKFIEVAKQLETFFLQRRLQLSVIKPDQLVKEDSSELKLEIARKDELIKKHYEKINVWLSMLADLPSSAALPGPGINEALPPQGALPQPQMPSSVQFQNR